jgi:hypothetical protein
MSLISDGITVSEQEITKIESRPATLEAPLLEVLEVTLGLAVSGDAILLPNYRKNELFCRASKDVEVRRNISSQVAE